MRKVCLAATSFAIGSTILLARENAPEPPVPVQMTVTVEARHGKEIPALRQEDVMAFQGNQRLQVTGLIPCQNEHAALELYILFDDATNSDLALQFDEVRHFIATQPTSTAIGIGYMRDGTVRVEQGLTTDHSRAAKALRLPIGVPGISPSPFLSLSDLIKKWPASPARHEVLMVSSGIDPLGGAIIDPYLDAAIEHAQRADIIAYSIYMPNAGHFGHSAFSVNWGQNHLAQLAEETGGESYWIGFGQPVTFAPYLTDIAEHLDHQYRVQFLIQPPGKKGGLQPVRLTTEAQNADIVAASKVYVPANH